MRVTFAEDTYPPQEATLALSIVRHENLAHLGYTEYTIQMYRCGRSWVVFRRYRHFDALNRDLKRENSDWTQHLPPLPQKRWFEKQRWLNRFDEDYSVERKRMLQAFLRGVIKIDGVLQQSQAIRAFLEIPESDDLSQPSVDNEMRKRIREENLTIGRTFSQYNKVSFDGPSTVDEEEPKVRAEEDVEEDDTVASATRDNTRLNSGDDSDDNSSVDINERNYRANTLKETEIKLSMDSEDDGIDEDEEFDIETVVTENKYQNGCEFGESEMISENSNTFDNTIRENPNNSEISVKEVPIETAEISTNNVEIEDTHIIVEVDDVTKSMEKVTLLDGSEAMTSDTNS